MELCWDLNLGHPVRDQPLSTPQHRLTFVSCIHSTGPSCFHKLLYIYHVLIPLLAAGRWAAMGSCSIYSQALRHQQSLTKASLQLVLETKRSSEFTPEMPQLHWHRGKNRQGWNSLLTIRNYMYRTIHRKCVNSGYAIVPLTASDPQPCLLVLKRH